MTRLALALLVAALASPASAAANAAASICRIAGNTGEAGVDLTVQTLTSNAQSNSTTTFATVMTTTAVGAGTWSFKYLVRYQSAAATTGVKFAVNHTGTAAPFLATAQYQTTGGAAATAAGDQVTTTVAQMVEGWSTRTKDGALGQSLSVDTANADMLTVIEGIAVVTATGDLQLKHASEVAAASTVMAGTILQLTKVQ